jgi:hypothetical protein
MSEKFVYVTYIRTTPEQLWNTLRKPEADCSCVQRMAPHSLELAGPARDRPGPARDGPLADRNVSR